MQKFELVENMLARLIKKYDDVVVRYDSIKGKHRIIDESINYYLAIFEFSIISIKNYRYYCYGEYKYQKEFIDNEKELADYLKFIFFNTETNRAYKELVENAYDKYNWYLVIFLLIYPDYYFDCIFDDCVENKIVGIVTKRKEYVQYLHHIIEEINKHKKIEVQLY